jgi:hypothetical protein
MARFHPDMETDSKPAVGINLSIPEGEHLNTWQHLVCRGLLFKPDASLSADALWEAYRNAHQFIATIDYAPNEDSMMV